MTTAQSTRAGADLHVRISPELMERIRVLCKDEKRTLVAQVELLLERGLKQK